MTKRFGKIAITSTAFMLAMLLSVDMSGQRGISLSVESAQARVGRPLTPVSVAGVARRQHRRAAYGYSGAYAARAAAACVVGAAMVAASAPPWSYNDHTYDDSPAYDAYEHPYQSEHYAAYAGQDVTYAGGYYPDSPWGYYGCRPYAHIGWYHY